jgi:hypothetical protein
VIAVELAHDPDDERDRPKALSRHGAIGHHERLDEPAHLQRGEVLRRCGHAAGDDLFYQRAHALLGHPDALGDFGDGDAAVEGIDDQPLALELARAAGASRLDRAVAGFYGGQSGDGCGRRADLLVSIFSLGTR